MNRLSAVVVLSLGFGAAAAPPTLMWQHPVGTGTTDETSFCIANTDTGGFIVCGRRLNANGNYDIVLMRLRDDGAVIWHRQMDTGANDMALSVIQTADGGFAVAGESVHPAAPLGTFLLKVNGLGNTQWGRIYWGAPFVAGTPAAKVIELPNGNLVVVSRANVPGLPNHNASAFCVTNAGVNVWAWAYQDGRYGPTGQLALLDVIPDPTGAPRLWAVGHTRQPPVAANREALSMQIDALTGVPISAIAYSVPALYDAYANAITPILTPGGVPQGLGLAGRYSNLAGTPNGSFFLRLALTGFPAAGFRNYPNFFVGTSALEHHLPPPTWIGEFSMAGSWAPAGAISDAALVRIDGGGGPLYMVRYGGQRVDEFNSLVRNNCGLAMAGRTDSFPAAAPTDHYHVKANADGITGCNEVREPIQSLGLNLAPVQFGVLRTPIQFSNFNLLNNVVPNSGFLKCLTCPADLNMDGQVDFNDYLEFLNLFNANSISVDFNCDGLVDFNCDGLLDFNDYLEFLNLFNAGC